MELELNINNDISGIFHVRGVAVVDGIKIPFTAYRYISIEDLQRCWNAKSLHHVAIRSKSGILNKYPNSKNHIKSEIKTQAIKWWIDNDYWRTNEEKC